MVSVSGPLWYSTLGWKTFQTVLAHHNSNYQQQECPFIYITSFSLSSYCTLLLLCLRSHLCSWLPRPQHFSSNLLSQQIIPFLPRHSPRCTALNGCYSHSLTYFSRPSQCLDKKSCFKMEAYCSLKMISGEDLIIQLVHHRLSLKLRELCYHIQVRNL